LNEKVERFEAAKTASSTLASFATMSGQPAHIAMLQKIGILTPQEHQTLKTPCKRCSIWKLVTSSKLSPQMKMYIQVLKISWQPLRGCGEKIHTAPPAISVLLDTRLYAKEQLHAIGKKLFALVLHS